MLFLYTILDDNKSLIKLLNICIVVCRVRMPEETLALSFDISKLQRADL